MPRIPWLRHGSYLVGIDNCRAYARPSGWDSWMLVLPIGVSEDLARAKPRASMIPSFLRALLCIATGALALPACRKQGSPGSELTSARLIPVLWDTPDSSTATASNGPPPSTCALRLRDENTGTEYQLQRRHASWTNPDAPAGTAAIWAQKGDYMRILPDPPTGPPSSYVQVECGTWKVIGLVASR